MEKKIAGEGGRARDGDKRGGCTSPWLNNSQDRAQERQRSLGGNENMSPAGAWGPALLVEGTARTKARRLELSGEPRALPPGRQAPSLTLASLTTRAPPGNGPGLSVRPSQVAQRRAGALSTCDPLLSLRCSCSVSFHPGGTHGRPPGPSPAPAPPWPGDYESDLGTLGRVGPLPPPEGRVHGSLTLQMSLGACVCWG